MEGFQSNAHAVGLMHAVTQQRVTRLQNSGGARENCLEIESTGDLALELGIFLNPSRRGRVVRPTQDRRIPERKRTIYKS